MINRRGIFKGVRANRVVYVKLDEAVTPTIVLRKVDGVLPTNSVVVALDDLVNASEVQLSEELTPQYGLVKVDSVEHPEELKPIVFELPVPEELMPHYRNMIQVAHDIGVFRETFVTLLDVYFQDANLFQDFGEPLTISGKEYKDITITVAYLLLPDHVGSNYLCFGVARFNRGKNDNKQAEEAKEIFLDDLANGKFEEWYKKRFDSEEGSDMNRLIATYSSLVTSLPEAVYYWLSDSSKLVGYNTMKGLGHAPLFEETQETLPQANARVTGLEISIRKNYGIEPEDMRSLHPDARQTSLPFYGFEVLQPVLALQNK